MSGSPPPMELELLCAPLTRGDPRPELLLALLEDVVGRRLEVELTPYAELRAVGDRSDLLDRAFFGRLWADRQLILVEGKEQTFCAFLSGSVHSEGSTPEQVRYKLFDLGVLLPVDLPLLEALDLIRRLARVGDVYVARLGSYVEGQHGIGEYEFRDLWPHKCTLSWINAWSAAYAKHLEFPGAEDHAHLRHIEALEPSAGYACALTEERLNSERSDHSSVVSWARHRFCQADQS